MATVELAGTTGDHVNDTGTGSGQHTVAYTIPTDATGVIVTSHGYPASSGNHLDELNWDDGGTVDFTLVASQRFDASYPNFETQAWIMTSADGDWPGTGAQTLYWSGRTNPSPDGWVINIFSVKGIDTSTPTGNTTGSDSSASGGTLTLADNNSADRMGVIVLSCYVHTAVGTVDTNSQTVVTENAAQNSVGSAIGVKNNDTGLDWTDQGAYHIPLAFTLLEDTGGGGGSVGHLTLLGVG